MGVIDTTTSYIEHPLTVAERIVRAARTIGDPTRVIASTDCGFETSTGSSAVAAPIVWQKLRALAEGAALASAVLFESGVPRLIAPAERWRSPAALKERLRSDSGNGGAGGGSAGAGAPGGGDVEGGVGADASSRL